MTNANKVYYEYLLGDAPAAVSVYIFPSRCRTEAGSQKVISIVLAAGQTLFATSAPFVLIAWWPTDCGEKEDPSEQGHPKIPKQLTGARRGGGIKNFHFYTK